MSPPAKARLFLSTPQQLVQIGERLNVRQEQAALKPALPFASLHGCRAAALVSQQ